MPPAIPPNSQYHSGLDVKLTSFEDLTDDQKKRCDDLIIKLGRANLTNDIPDDATRKGLWDRVFTGWDTDDKITPPSDKPRDRVAEDSQLHIGYLNTDLPGKKGNVSAVRKAGARAFIKPNVTWDGYGVLYNLVDKNGAGVPTSSVVFDDAVTPQQARVLVSAQWDRNESNRIGAWNINLVVFWARHRLVDSVEAGECRDGTTASQRANDRVKQAFRARIAEHHDQLVQLRQISTIIQKMQEIVDDMTAMAASGKARVTLHSLKRAI